MIWRDYSISLEELAMFTFRRITELKKAEVLDLYDITINKMLKMQLMDWMGANMMVES